MGLLKQMEFLVKHPLNRRGRAASISRFARWQLATRLMPTPMAVEFAGGTKLLMERGMTGATGNWYCGLHEPQEMAFVLHSLRADDLFVDIGANVGSYTVLAAGAVGAEVIAVEPLPATFAKLQANIRINALGSRTRAECCGLSNMPGELLFVSSLDTMNRVALPGDSLPTIRVSVKTLDELCGERVPSVIKIDVEGHELAVLEGGTQVLRRPELQAVLMETNGSGEKFGSSDQALIRHMASFGFSTFAYEPLLRKLSPASAGSHNTIFVRDADRLQARCLGAPRFSLVNGSI